MNPMNHSALKITNPAPLLLHPEPSVATHPHGISFKEIPFGRVIVSVNIHGSSLTSALTP